MSMNPSLTTASEPEFGYGQILGILLRRFMWVGGTVIVSVALALISTIREEPVYESSMQLLIEPNYRETVDITNQDSASSSASQVDYVTQLNLMQSETFIQRAVDKILVDYPNFCGSGDEATLNCAKRNQNSLALAQVVEDDTATRIFSARFKANDPVVVKDFLEKLGEVYLSYNEEQQDQRLEEGLALVNQQIKEVQGDLAGSRQELKQFREAGTLINPREEALEVAKALRDVEQAGNDTANALLEAEAEYNAMQDQLSADLSTAFLSSQLSQSPRYQRLLEKLQEIEIELDQRLALYAEADPGVQNLDRQRQQQISLLQEEAQRILGDGSTQITISENALLSEGQLSAIELDLVSNLVKTDVRLKSLSARQRGLAQTADTLQARLDTFPDLISVYDRIQPEVEIQEQSLQKLLQIRQKLSNEIAQGGFNWDVVEAPRVGRKIAPLPKRNIMMGVIAGVFLGGALAFGRDSIDKSVRTSEQLRKQSTLPLLGIIPEIPSKTWGPFSLTVSRDAIAATASQAIDLAQHKPFRDAVDLTYKTIQLSSPDALTSLMVTSASIEEGKTTLAVGLALSAARSHQRVLLLDCNLRNPSLHNYFDLPNEEGLSTQLPEHSLQPNRFKIALTTVSVDGIDIDVLPAGPTPEDPMSILSSVQMRCFLARAEATYDLVVVDSPPILGLADSLQIASMCKASIMVSRLDKTTQADINQAMPVLTQINTIGIVANGHRQNNYQETPYESNGSSKSFIKEPIMLWQR